MADASTLPNSPRSHSTMPSPSSLITAPPIYSPLLLQTPPRPRPQLWTQEWEARSSSHAGLGYSICNSQDHSTGKIIIAEWNVNYHILIPVKSFHCQKKRTESS